MAEAPKHFDCPKCGRRYYEPQRFCLDCGLDFRAAFRKCPRCKADTPREGEKCVECDYDLTASDMRRPQIIAGAIVIGIIFLILAIPYWWMHSPIGKNQGIIITGKVYMLTTDSLKFVPMFYEYQAGQKSLRKALQGGDAGIQRGMDASKLIPLPPPTIVYENLSIGEKVYVIRKTRDSDGNRWYHIRRYRKDVVRKGWVHETNIRFE